MERFDANTAWDHAWKHFNIHATQRMSVFNFYLILVGLLTAGLVKTFEKDFPFPLLGSVLGVVLAIVSFVFWKLDNRTRFLLKMAEAALKELEGALNDTDTLTGEAKLELKIFTHEALETKQLRRRYVPTTYAECFHVMFALFAVLGFAGAILAVINQLQRGASHGNNKAPCVTWAVKESSNHFIAPAVHCGLLIFDAKRP